MYICLKGTACGFCGSVMVTISSVFIIFLADDTRGYFADPIGINNKNQANQLQPNAIYTNYSYEYTVNNMTVHDDEWYVLPVIDAKIWWSKVTMYKNANDSMTDDMNSFSLINGIQLIYDFEGDIINGDVFGSNHTMNNIFDDAVTVEIESNRELLGNIGDIKVLNVYQDQNGLIHALQFNDDGVVFGISNNMKLDKIQNEDYHLGGYQVTTSFVDIDFYDDSNSLLSLLSVNNMNIISGFESMAFVHEEGQYGNTLALQLAYFLVGFWFLVFSIPAFCFLKQRVRDPIPKGSTWWNISIKSYWSVAKKAKEYPDLIRYLIVWFLFSDAMGTTAGCGILFGVTELGMTSFQLVLLMIEVEFCAVIGAFFFVWLQKKLQWSSKQMLVMHLIFLSLLPFYAIFGLIEGASFGLVSIWEMYMFVAFFGFNQGSILALSRSLFGQFIPNGYESQFYGLYEITDKGSSWIGPMMVAVVSNISSMRWALVYIFIFYMLALPLLYFGVDYHRGVKQAKVDMANDENNDSSKDAKEESGDDQTQSM